MSTENAKIKIRNRQTELKLTFEYADHIMHGFIHSNPPHDVGFLEIQKIAKRAKYVHVRNRIWRGICLHNGKNYVVIIIFTGKFAVVKTSFYINYAK